MVIKFLPSIGIVIDLIQVTGKCLNKILMRYINGWFMASLVEILLVEKYLLLQLFKNSSTSVKVLYVCSYTARLYVINFSRISQIMTCNCKIPP